MPFYKDTMYRIVDGKEVCDDLTITISLLEYRSLLEECIRIGYEREKLYSRINELECIIEKNSYNK